jgi:F-type H+-transporting ATPase subunit b
MFPILMQVASTTTTTAAPEAISKNPILPAVNELVWGSVSFVLLFLLLWKFGFPAIRNGVAARTERIRGDIASAEQAKADAEAVLSQYQAQLADAKNESNRIIEEARATADALRRDLIAKAEADAAEVRSRATADIDAAKDRALAEVQTQLTQLTIDLAERVVKRSIDRDANTALVDEYIASIRSRN